MADRLPHVCVLEDDDAVRESLGWMLERNGYSVQTFRTPNDFLLSAELDQYDCLIVDAGLPGLSGLELIELLRKRAYSKPAILISSMSQPRLDERMKMATTTELLAKPIEPATLLLALRKAVGTTCRALRT
jgi:FixJ family two-component response regulator